jgi:para-nitrobenzyl esterase
LVWIHGGGFVEGSATVPVYNGANLAANGNLIVVAINYRLGVFGFLAHPALTMESGTSGNYGLMDQVAALEWIGSNIGAFGGDPQNITIAGQSAGAGSVLTLIVTPSARGLFKRAIAESGPGVGSRAGPFEKAEANGEAFMRAAGVSSLADLRRMPADAVLKAAIDYTKKAGVPFRAVADGHFLPREAEAIQISSADFNDTPILAGYNADEGSGFDASYGSWTQAEIDKQIGDFGPLAERARSVYMPSDPVSLSDVGKQMSRDRSMAAMYLWAKQRLTQSRSPMFLYNYLHTEPGSKSVRYGAFHTSEVPYVFQNLSASSRIFGLEDQQVSKLISGYWINFIATGNPNGPGLATWPAFNLTGAPVMRIDTAATPSPILSSDKLELYEKRYTLMGNMLGR